MLLCGSLMTVALWCSGAITSLFLRHVNCGSGSAIASQVRLTTPDKYPYANS